ncbi:hypothetical protein D1AOALGA4SA_2845 [Olavius algarvensis Delta 1 endosymbiont]|nr:hypothetical protein D1AOALGA4SA_2845 [Olavius algarvensis Delta 1 endosymbiont]
MKVSGVGFQVSAQPPPKKRPIYSKDKPIVHRRARRER